MQIKTYQLMRIDDLPAKQAYNAMAARYNIECEY